MKLFFETYNYLKRAEKGRIVLIFLLRILVVGLDLAGIALIGIVVSLVAGTTISPTSTLGLALNFLNELGQKQGYIIFAILAVTFFTMKSLVSIGLTRVAAELISRIETQRAVDFFGKLITAKAPQLSKFRAAEISSTAHQGIHAAFTEILTAGGIIVGEISLLLAVSVFLMYTNPVAFLSLACFFGLVGITMNIGISARAAKASETFHKSELQGQAHIHEFLSNFRQISSSPRRANFIEEFAQARGVFSKEKAKYAQIASLPRHLTEISILFGIGILVLQRNGSSILVLDSPTIAIFVAGIFRIVAAMVPLQSALSSISANAPSAKLALELLSSFTKPAKNSSEKISPNVPSDSILDKSQVHISIHNLSFKFPDQKRYVLHNVNLEISRGEFIAITGRSGAGKSTLADLLSGIGEPTSGRITINGLRADSNDPSFRSLVSYVPQITTLVSGSLYKNITFESDITQVDQKKLRRAIRAANLQPVVRRLTNGLETVLGSGSQNLSGGEIQRIGIARAIYNNPKVIIMDEGTSALDAETQAVISNSLLQLKGKVTLIVIAHRKSTLKQADREFRVSAGNLALAKTKN